MPRFNNIAGDSYAVVFGAGDNITAEEFYDHLSQINLLGEDLDIGTDRYSLAYREEDNGSRRIIIRHNRAEVGNFAFARNGHNPNQITVISDLDLIDGASVNRIVMNGCIAECGRQKEELRRMAEEAEAEARRLAEENARRIQNALRPVFESVEEGRHRYYRNRADNQFYRLEKAGGVVSFSRLEGNGFLPITTLQAGVDGNYQLSEEASFDQLIENCVAPNGLSDAKAAVLDQLQNPQPSFFRRGRTAYCKTADGNFHKVNYREDNSPLIVAGVGAGRGVEDIQLLDVFNEIAEIDDANLPEVNDVRALADQLHRFNGFNDLRLEVSNVDEILVAQQALRQRQDQLHVLYGQFAFPADTAAYQIRHGNNYLVTQDRDNNSIVLNTVENDFVLTRNGSLTRNADDVYVLDGDLAIFQSLSEPWSQNRFSFIAAADRADKGQLYRNGNLGCYVTPDNRIFRIQYDAVGSLHHEDAEQLDLFGRDIEGLAEILDPRNLINLRQIAVELNGALGVAGIEQNERASDNIAAALERQNVVHGVVERFTTLKANFSARFGRAGFEDDQENQFGDITVVQADVGGGAKTWTISRGANHYQIQFAQNGNVERFGFSNDVAGPFLKPTIDQVNAQEVILNGIRDQIRTNAERFDDICDLLTPQDPEQLFVRTAEDGSVSYYQLREDGGTRYVVKYSYEQRNGQWNWGPDEIRAADAVDPDRRARLNTFVTNFSTFAQYIDNQTHNRPQPADNRFSQVQLNEIRQQISALVLQDPQHVQQNLRSATTGRATEEYHSCGGGKWYKFDEQRLQKVRDAADGGSINPEVLDLVTELNEIKRRQLGFGVGADGTALDLDKKKRLVNSILQAQPDGEKSELSAIRIANEFLGFGQVVDRSANHPVFIGASKEYYERMAAGRVKDALAAFAAADHNVVAFAGSNNAYLENLAATFYENLIDGNAAIAAAGKNAEALRLYQSSMNRGCRAALDSVIRCYEDGIGCDADDQVTRNRLATLKDLRDVLNKENGTINVDGDQITVQLVDGGLRVSRARGNVNFIVNAELDGHDPANYDPANPDHKAIISQIKFALLQEGVDTVRYGTTQTPIKPIALDPNAADFRALCENFAQIEGLVTIGGDGLPEDQRPKYRITKVADDKYDLKEDEDVGASYRIRFRDGQAKITKRNEANANSRAVSATVQHAINFDNLRLGFVAQRDQRQYGWAEAGRQQIIRDRLDQIPNNNAANDNRISFFYNGAEHFIKKDRDTDNFEIGIGAQVLFQIGRNHDGTLILNKTNPAGAGFVPADTPVEFLNAILMLQSFRSPKEILADIVAKIPSDTQIKVGNPARYFIVDRSTADNPILREYRYAAHGTFVDPIISYQLGNAATVPAIDQGTMQGLINLLTPYYVTNPPAQVEEARTLSQLSYDLRMAIENHPQAENISPRVGRRTYSLPERIFNPAAAVDAFRQYGLDVVTGNRVRIVGREVLGIRDVLQTSSQIRASQNVFGLANTGITEEQKGALTSAVAATLSANERYRATIIVNAFLGIDRDGISKATVDGVGAVFEDATIPHDAKIALRTFARDSIARLNGPSGLNLRGVFYELGIHVDPTNPQANLAVAPYRAAAADPGDGTPESITSREAALKNLIRCYQQGTGIAEAERPEYKNKGDYLEGLLWAVKNGQATIGEAPNQYDVTKDDGDSRFTISKVGAVPDDVFTIELNDAVVMPHPITVLPAEIERNRKFQSVLEKFVTQRSHQIAKESITALGRINDGLSFVGATSANLTMPVPTRLTTGNAIFADAVTSKARFTMDVPVAPAVGGAPVPAVAPKKYYQCFEERSLFGAPTTVIYQVDTDGKPIKTQPYYIVTKDAAGVVSKIEKRVDGVVGRNTPVPSGSYSLNPQDAELNDFIDIVAEFDRLQGKMTFDGVAEIASIRDLNLEVLNLEDPAHYDQNVRTKFRGTAYGLEGEYEITKQDVLFGEEYLIKEIFLDENNEKKSRNFAKITVDEEEVSVYGVVDRQAGDYTISGDVVANSEEFWQIRNLMDGIAGTQHNVTKAEALFDDRLRVMDANLEYRNENPATVNTVYFVKTLDSKGNPTLHQYKRSAVDRAIVKVDLDPVTKYKLAGDVASLGQARADVFKAWAAGALGAGNDMPDAAKTMPQLVHECRNMMFANHDVAKIGGVQVTIFDLNGQKYYVGGVTSSVMYRAGNPDVEMELMEVISLKRQLRIKEISRVSGLAEGAAVADQPGIGLDRAVAERFVDDITRALADDNRRIMALERNTTGKFRPELAGRIAVDFLGLDADADGSKETIEGIYNGAPERVKQVLREFAVARTAVFAPDGNPRSNPFQRNLAGVFKEMGIHVDRVVPNLAEALRLYREASVVPAVVAPPAAATINKSALSNVIRCYRKGIGIDDAEKAAYKAKGDVLEDLQWALGKEVGTQFNGYTVTVAIDDRDRTVFHLEGATPIDILIGDQELPANRDHVAVLNNIRLQRSSARLQETMTETFDSFSASVARTPYWERALIGVTAGPVVGSVALTAGVGALGVGGLGLLGYGTYVGTGRAATLAGVNYAQTPLNVERQVNVARGGEGDVNIATIINECARRKVRGDRIPGERYQVFEENPLAERLPLHTKRYSLRRIDAQGNIIKTEPYYFINIDERDPNPANRVITRIEKRKEGVVGRNNSLVDLGSYSLNAQAADNNTFEEVAGILGNLRNKAAFDDPDDVPSMANLRDELEILAGATDANQNVRYKFKSAGDRRGEDYEITKEEGVVESYIIREIYVDGAGEKKAHDYVRITITNEANPAGGGMIDVVRVYRADEHHVLPVIDPANRNNGVANADQFWQVRNLMEGLSDADRVVGVTRAQAFFDDRLRAMDANLEYRNGDLDNPDTVYFVKTLDSKGNPTLHQYKRTTDRVMTEVVAGSGYDVTREQMDGIVNGAAVVVNNVRVRDFKAWSADALVAGRDRDQNAVSLDATAVANQLTDAVYADEQEAINHGAELRTVDRANYNAYRAGGTSYVVEAGGNLRGLKIERNRVYSGKYTATLQPEFNGFETAKAASDIIAEVKRREVEASLATVRDYLIGKVRAQMPLDPLADQKAGDIVDAFLGVRDLRQGPPVEMYPTARPDPAVRPNPPIDQELSVEIKNVLRAYAWRTSRDVPLPALLVAAHDPVGVDLNLVNDAPNIVSDSLKRHFVATFESNGASAIGHPNLGGDLRLESANRGNSYAQNALGRVNLPLDQNLSRQYYIKSAKQGNKAAMEALVTSYGNGTPEEQEKSRVLRTMIGAAGHRDLNMPGTFLHGERKYEVSQYDVEKGFVITDQKTGTELARVKIGDDYNHGVVVTKVIDSSLRQFFGGIGTVGEDGKTERSHVSRRILSAEAMGNILPNYGRGKVTRALDDIEDNVDHPGRLVYNAAMRGDINEVRNQLQLELQQKLTELFPLPARVAVGAAGNLEAKALADQFLNMMQEGGNGSDYISKSDFLSKQPSEVRLALQKFAKDHIKAFEHSTYQHFQDLAGQFYLDGIGVEMDRDKAFGHFAKAANVRFVKNINPNPNPHRPAEVADLVQADPKIDHDVYIVFGDNIDPGTIDRDNKTAFARDYQGSAIALYHLGSIFRSDSFNRPRDASKAFQCWERSAAIGMVGGRAVGFQPAKTMVAYCLLNGDGCAKNEAEAYAMRDQLLQSPKSAIMRADIVERIPNPLEPRQTQTDRVVAAAAILKADLTARENLEAALKAAETARNAAEVTRLKVELEAHVDPAVHARLGEIYERGIALPNRSDKKLRDPKDKFEEAKAEYEKGVAVGDVAAMCALADLYDKRKVTVNTGNTDLKPSGLVNDLRHRADIFIEMEKATAGEIGKGLFNVGGGRLTKGKDYKVTKVKDGYVISVNGEEKEGFKISGNGRFYVVSKGRMTLQENGIYNNQDFKDVCSVIKESNARNAKANLTGVEGLTDELHSDLVKRLTDRGICTADKAEEIARDFLGRNYFEKGKILPDGNGSRYPEYNAGNYYDIARGNSGVAQLLQGFVLENEMKFINSNHPHMQNLLGLFYEKGILSTLPPAVVGGVRRPVPNNRAQECYQRADAQGYMPAQHNLVKITNLVPDNANPFPRAAAVARLAALSPLVDRAYLPAILDSAKVSIDISRAANPGITDDQLVRTDLNTCHAIMTERLAWLKARGKNGFNVTDDDGNKTFYRVSFNDRDKSFSISEVGKDELSSEVIKISSIGTNPHKISAVNNGEEIEITRMDAAERIRVIDKLSGIAGQQGIGAEQRKEAESLANIQGIVPNPVAVNRMRGAANVLGAAAARITGR